jgi:hypothetical protein
MWNPQSTHQVLLCLVINGYSIISALDISDLKEENVMQTLEFHTDAEVANAKKCH